MVVEGKSLSDSQELHVQGENVPLTGPSSQTFLDGLESRCNGLDLFHHLHWGFCPFLPLERFPIWGEANFSKPFPVQIV